MLATILSKNFWLSIISPGSIGIQLVKYVTSTIYHIDGNELTGLDHRTLRRFIIDCKPICKAMQTVSAILGTTYGHDRNELVGYACRGLSRSSSVLENQPILVINRSTRLSSSIVNKYDNDEVGTYVDHSRFFLTCYHHDTLDGFVPLRTKRFLVSLNLSLFVRLLNCLLWKDLETLTRQTFPNSRFEIEN